ncbi:DUF6765 family protein [Chromobacterium alticapitis]|uniref:Uncharacterized protein n=1 Tax=Chromobacterium alticapitis TaxID=2073169 RepID=A0A2S5DC57_9NEIS|nr:DUF6765 family protein [Chromobacterium alticapitis]POZ60618.1 hypothetical protein C2I19_17915 [Chromobacterium alticapitis]
MEIDFHYYATYLAAGLAGYSTAPAGEGQLSDAAIIAHAAQYVDDLDESRVLDDDGCFRIQSRDFTPVATVQTNGQIGKMEIGVGEWPAERLKKLRRIWSAFHFLPGNYGNNPERLPYGDPAVLRSGGEDYARIGEEFQLLCRPNSLLVDKMVHDLARHAREPYFLHLLGLRMHVLADTWAHMNYAGTPSCYVNDAQPFVWDNAKRAPIPFAPFSATPSTFTPRSVAYLGHGRMGHLPDCPWLVYTYQPLWSDAPITKNNPADYLMAFRQLVAVLSWARKGAFEPSFSPRGAPELSKEVETQLMALLTRPFDINGSDMPARLQTWAKAIPSFQANGVALTPAPDYQAERWPQAFRQNPGQNSDHYRFSQAAALHLELVAGEVKAATGIDFVPAASMSAPPPTLVWGSASARQRVKLLSQEKSPRGLGAFAARAIDKQYYPKLTNAPQPFSLLLQPGKSDIRNGDLVQVLSEEPELAYYRVLGQWKTGLYYYTQRKEWAPQSWIVRSADPAMQDGAPIAEGSAVTLQNLASQAYLGWSPDSADIITRAAGHAGNVWLLQPVV